MPVDPSEPTIPFEAGIDPADEGAVFTFINNLGLDQCRVVSTL